jgi:transcriptional regulator GlxA family with amidase domain
MTRPFSTGFLIFPGFPMACLTSMIEPLRAANEISGSQAFSWTLVAECTGKVESSALVEFEPTCTVAEAEGFDLMILLSAPTAEFTRSATPGRLRSLQRHGTMLGAVSGGVFPLTRCEVTQGARLAVHWCYRAAFDVAFPECTPSDRVIEISRTLVTAAGAAAAFDLSLHLIEQRLGAGVATEVACWFQHPVMRREGVVQAVPALASDANGTELSGLVARAVRLFASHMAEPVSVATVADQLGISPRHLERAFKQDTGLAPTRYYRKLRMDAARQMVLYTNDRITNIAIAVGYASLKTFSAHYQAAFGLRPKEERDRINLFRVKGNLPVPSV